jgi:hypothetical protein
MKEPIMANPEHLRLVAQRMMALALESSGEEVACLLRVRASEYLDQAAELEAAARPPVPEAAQREAQGVKQPNDLKKEEQSRAAGGAAPTSIPPPLIPSSILRFLCKTYARHLL